MRRQVKATAIVALILAAVGCMDAGMKWQTQFQDKLGVVSDRLEKITEQTGSTSATARKIDALTQTVNQKIADKIELMHSDIQAREIRYGGAGWVVLGAGLVVLLFLAAGGLGIWLVIRNAANFKNLLTLVTTAVQKAPPAAQEAVKAQIEQETSNGGPFGAKHKEALAAFAKQVGTFAFRMATQK